MLPKQNQYVPNICSLLKSITLQKIFFQLMLLRWTQT